MGVHWVLGSMVRMLGVCLASSAFADGPAIDPSPDRVATDLQPGLARIGTIKPRSTFEIESSNWTLGCETVDRDFTDYHAYKHYLAPLGIKKIRFQGGAKCEKTRGVYDFKWLDDIVADAKSRGLRFWR